MHKLHDVQFLCMMVKHMRTCDERAMIGLSSGIMQDLPLFKSSPFKAFLNSAIQSLGLGGTPHSERANVWPGSMCVRDLSTLSDEHEAIIAWVDYRM